MSDIILFVFLKNYLCINKHTEEAIWRVDLIFVIIALQSVILQLYTKNN